MMQVVLPELQLHAGQRRVIEGRRKRNVCAMGRRWGKTMLMQDLITVASGSAFGGPDGTGRVGLPCAWYAPTDAYYRRVYRDIVIMYAPIIRRATTSPRPRIEFSNGGSIDFWTLERPQHCGRGNRYARVVIDEAAHSPYLQEAWEQSIVWTLADYDGDAWFISTPFGINYFHDLYQRGLQGGEWASFHAPSTDNPYLSKDWIEQQRQQLPDLVFRQEVMAEFVDISGGALIQREWLRYYDERPHCTYVAIGVDLAISRKTTADYTCAVVVGYGDDGKLYIIDVWRSRGATLRDTIRTVVQLASTYDAASVVVESVGYQQVVIDEMLRTTALNVVAAKPSTDKVTRAQGLVARIEHGMVYLPRNAAWLNDYVQELIAFPVGEHDDQVDATVYALQAMVMSPHYEVIYV